MPVEVEQEQLAPCKVALAVHVPPEQFQQAVDRVFHQMAKRTQVPGFRPGKAPRRLLERVIDQDRVQEIALERVVRDGYREALEQTGLTPFGEPDLEMEDREEGQPVSFRVTIPLAPRVELGEFKGLTFTRMEAQVTDESVEAELNRTREGSARFEDVDEPSHDGDRVLATVRISIDGQEIAEAGIDTPAWLQVGTNLDEFDAGITGVSAGEEKTFSFRYPEDFSIEDRRGKEAEAQVKVTKVQRRIVPEADDAFAESLGYDNLDALRAAIRSRLQERAASLADSELDSAIVREVVARSTVDFPEEMVTREVADDIAAFVKRLERSRTTLEQYLDANEMDLQKLEADYAERARPRIANTLVLMEIARQNEIEVQEADVEAEIERRAAAARAEPKVMRRILEEQDEMESLRNSLFYRKTLEFLKSENTIETKTV